MHVIAMRAKLVACIPAYHGVLNSHRDPTCDAAGKLTRICKNVRSAFFQFSLRTRWQAALNAEVALETEREGARVHC